MRKFAPFFIIAVALAALLLRGHFLPSPRGAGSYLGYVEGESVLISAPSAGKLVALHVEKGGQVALGDPLFDIDPTIADAELARAEAALAGANARLENLLSGKRQPELAAISAQRREAEANLALARRELERASVLITSGAAAQVRLDAARSQVSAYEARVAQFMASEEAGKLAAREAEIEAARAATAEFLALRREAAQRRAELSPRAPLSGLVEDRYFDAGEWVGTGQPVISLLAPDRIKLRFFVPETALALARPGLVVRFSCDSCPADLTARITRIAATPEYTPPVIYSQEARAKLVFLVEALPEKVSVELRPGLPIEVEALN
jgi:HlyD family secretion protein